jgi:tryptophanyl-tRNA synthetase
MNSFQPIPATCARLTRVTWRAIRSSNITMHSIWTKANVQELKNRYVVARVGDVEVKRQLVDALNRFLEPIREDAVSWRANLTWS